MEVSRRRAGKHSPASVLSVLAVARGVDLYVGSQAVEVRDRVRREVPGATLWEPQIDWLDPPAGTDSVARLVVADRSVVLLGTHAGGSGEDATAEVAITATGEDTALVLLLGELFGSRFDHVDEGNGDSTSEIRSE